MTDAQDTTTFIDSPCEQCGADVGEVCRPYCAAAAAYADEVEDGVYAQEPGEETDYETEAKRALMAILYTMPLSGAAFVSTPPNYGDCPTDQWIYDVAVWMSDYRTILKAELEKLQADSRRAMGLQFERDVVRGFLGLGTTKPTTTTITGE